MEDRIDRAASLYDPSFKSTDRAPETSMDDSTHLPSQSKPRMAHSKPCKPMPRINASRGKPNKARLNIKSNKDRQKDQKDRQRPFSPIMSIVDQGIVERYKRLQNSSLEYMHLIEQEARNLLEVQQEVMQVSFHLEHIRKEHGGYVTSATVLNSGERGSKEALAKEKAFFEHHIANLESELVSANKTASKEIILQDKIVIKVNEHRRHIQSKKITLVNMNQDIERYRQDCFATKKEIKESKRECMKEQERMKRMKVTEKSIMYKLDHETNRIHQQKMDAAIQFKNNMTSSKQEVERHRRKVNLERLKSQPRRPQTSQGLLNILVVLFFCFLRSEFGGCYVCACACVFPSISNNACLFFYYFLLFFIIFYYFRSLFLCAISVI